VAASLAWLLPRAKSTVAWHEERVYGRCLTRRRRTILAEVQYRQYCTLQYCTLPYSTSLGTLTPSGAVCHQSTAQCSTLHPYQMLSSEHNTTNPRCPRVCMHPCHTVKPICGLGLYSTVTVSARNCHCVTCACVSLSLQTFHFVRLRPFESLLVQLLVHVFCA